MLYLFWSCPQSFKEPLRLEIFSWFVVSQNLECALTQSRRWVYLQIYCFGLMPKVIIWQMRHGSRHIFTMNNCGCDFEILTCAAKISALLRMLHPILVFMFSLSFLPPPFLTQWAKISKIAPWTIKLMYMYLWSVHSICMPLLVRLIFLFFSCNLITLFM